MPNRDRRGLDAHERRVFVTLALIGVQLVVLAERSRTRPQSSEATVKTTKFGARALDASGHGRALGHAELGEMREGWLSMVLVELELGGDVSIGLSAAASWAICNSRERSEWTSSGPGEARPQCVSAVCSRCRSSRGERRRGDLRLRALANADGGAPRGRARRGVASRLGLVLGGRLRPGRASCRYDVRAAARAARRICHLPLPGAAGGS